MDFTMVGVRRIMECYLGPRWMDGRMNEWVDRWVTRLLGTTVLGYDGVLA